MSHALLMRKYTKNPKKLGAQLGQVTLAKSPKGCSRPENIMEADVGLGMGSGIGQEVVSSCVVHHLFFLFYYYHHNLLLLCFYFNY